MGALLVTRSRRSRFGSITPTKSGKYRLRYPHPDGSRKTKTVPTRELAELARSKLEVDFARGKILGEDPIAEIPFRAFSQQYLRSIEGRQSPNTIAEKTCRMARLDAFFGDTPMHEVQRRHVTRLRAELYADGLSHASVNRVLTILSAVFTEAIELGHAAVHPVRGIKRAREPKRKFAFIDIAGQQEVIRACGQVSSDLGLACMVTLDTGLRAGELTRLETSHVSLEREQLTVHQSKNRRPRLVPIPTRSLAPLRNKLAAVAGEKFIFPWRTHRNEMRWLWQRARTAAGRPTLRWHDLRHLYAVTMIQPPDPSDFPTVARLLGTSLAVVVSTYADHAPNNYMIHAKSGMDRRHAEHLKRNGAAG